MYAWGFGKLGQLGSGSFRGSVLPVELKLDKSDRPSQICTGGLFTAIVTQKGDVYVCGCGKYGRLGLGHEADVNRPTKVTPAKDAKVCQVKKTYLSIRVVWLFDCNIFTMFAKLSSVSIKRCVYKKCRL